MTLMKTEMPAAGRKKLLSIVVSVYNEEPALGMFFREAVPVFDSLRWDYELIFVNDGSSDRSGELLREFAAGHPKVRVIEFSRNFGHEAAMIAGIDYSAGDGVVCMDADLQHPPECLREIIDRFDEGYEVISMVRTKNTSAGLIKNLTSAAFYWLINRISDVKMLDNASDFFAVSADAAEVLRKDYREKVRFLRGYIQNIGFRRTSIEYEARPRAAGHSKYSIRKLSRLAINTILCFSDMPLKLGIYSGFLVGLLGLILMIYTIVSRLRGGTPSGYATIVVVICFMFAMLFVLIGIIGEYIAVLFAEIKDRPVYIVRDTVNLPKKPLS
jgi:glycosyltransferase involved in cell wall biosynthesis